MKNLLKSDKKTKITVKEVFIRKKAEWAIMIDGKTIGLFDDRQLAILLKAVSNNPELYCSLS